MSLKLSTLTLAALLGMLLGMPDACAASHRSKKHNKDSWDYVIVGCGTAGATLAAKLSDPDKNGKFKHSVLVLESGINQTQSPDVLANLGVGR